MHNYNRIASHHRKGMKLKDLAKLADCSIGTAWVALVASGKRRNRPGRPSGGASAKVRVMCAKSHKSNAEIAAEVGCSQALVRVIRSRIGRESA